MVLSYEHAFLRALALSVASELLVVWFAVRLVLAMPSEALGGTRLLAAALLATGATLPYVWFLAPSLVCLEGARVAGVECAVALAEAGVYRLVLPLSTGRCLGLSVAANITSWGLGTLLRGGS